LDRRKLNVLHTVKRSKANWNNHILCVKCLPKYVTVSKKKRRKKMKGTKNEEEGVRSYWVDGKERRRLTKLTGGTLDCTH